MEDFLFQPIGIIHSPFFQTEGMPVQPCGAAGAEGVLELNHDLVEGLADLDGFSHVWLIYVLHKTGKPRLRVKPFLDDHEHGIFATRSPARPNPIGMSLVSLLGIDGNKVRVGNIDVLDGTPLLDIKPYVPSFDQAESARIGWFDGKVDQAPTRRADNRFG